MRYRRVIGLRLSVSWICPAMAARVKLIIDTDSGGKADEVPLN